ncbi:MAG: immunoglobulin domain-containing protein [Opitutaceae bacterium]
MLHAQETWQVRPSGVTNNLWSVAYATNQWVAVGEQGTILTSPDGISWTKRPSGFPTRWLVSVGYGAGIWIAVGEGGLVLTSPDAVVWTPRISGTTARLNGIAYGGARWIAVAESGELITSTDSANWTKLSPSTDRLRGLLYAYGQFVITGDNGLMRTTIDTTDYAANVLPGGFFVESVAYGRRAFVAVGEDGYAITSTDAVTWSSLASGTTSYLRGITFFNGQFIAVGTSGAILTTPAPGTAWTPRPSGTTGVLTAVAASDAAVVTVGLDGIIVRSAPTPAAPVVTTSPRSLTDAVGSNVLFAVTATGSPPLAYRWFFNGQTIAGQTSDRLLLVDLQSSQAGSYSATVSNALGVANSAPATLQFVATTAPGPIVDPSFAPTLIMTGGVTAAVEQPDGKVIIGGSQFFVTPGVSPFTLARLSVDGSLDPTFNPGVGLNAGGTVSQLLLQPDGRMLVAGAFQSINGLARLNLARLNADGSVDPAFTPAFGATEALKGNIALQSDGKILVLNGTQLLRISSDGSIDPEFNGPGGTFPISIWAQLGGEKIIGGADFLLRRLNSDGTIDEAVSAITSMSIRNSSLTPTVEGDVLVVGSLSGYSIGTQTILRIKPDGGITNRGIPFLPPAGTGLWGFSGTLLAIGVKGKILVSTTVRPKLSSLSQLLLRLNSDGSVDQTFDQRAGANAPISLIYGLRDGRVLIAGSFTTFDGVARPNLVRLVAANAPESQAPVIVSLTPEAASVLPGTSVALAVAAAGTGPLIYKWNEVIPGSDSGKSVVSVPTNIAGTYTATVTVSNRVGSVTSAPVRIVVAPSAPLLTGLPATLTKPTGRTATLSVTAAGTAPFSYQWFRGSTPVGTGSTLTIKGVTDAAAGAYTVVVTNNLGSTRSLPVQLTVDGGARLTNIATRAGTGPSENTLTAGFVITGAATKTVLVRGIGPGLAAFGLTGLLPNPKLTLFDAAGKTIATNDDFVSSATPNGLVAAVSAFPLSNSRDAALVSPLPSGSYTVQLTDSGAGSGVALVEVYEADDNSNRIVNLSSRAFVGTGASIAIGGISVQGEKPRQFLIRGIGPALRAFGVNGALGDPVLTLTTALGTIVATNDDWGSATNAFEIITTSATVGAFALPSGSKDAVLLISLAPGNYTALIAGANDTTGIALVEVYEVP